MPTTLENLSQVRTLLDDPDAQRPSDRTLWEILSNNIQHQLSQMQNSGAQWAVNDWSLTATSGTEDYLVTATDFGKPFMMYTEDPTDVYTPRVEIPFAMMQNADQFYRGPRQVYSTSDNIPTAQLASFYRKADGWYVRLTPVPGGSATYRIWYETLPGAPDSLGTTPGMSPFHHLLRVQTALAALPYCGWGDVSLRGSADGVKRWQTKTQALALSLKDQEAKYQREFSTYLGTLMQAGVEQRQGFGDGAYDDSSFGYGWFGPNSF